VDLILSFVDRRDPCGETMAIAQRGSGFSERFHNAMCDAARLGYDRIVAIPIDVPELSGSHLQRALLALRESPFVLGPSPDGGVYLIGFHANAMPALEDISWNTNRVFAQLAQAMPLAGVIEPLADIDDASDVRALLSQHLLDPQLKALLRTMLNRAPAEREPVRCLQPRLLLSRLPARAPPLG